MSIWEISSNPPIFVDITLSGSLQPRKWRPDSVQMFLIMQSWELKSCAKKANRTHLLETTRSKLIQSIRFEKPTYGKKLSWSCTFHYSCVHEFNPSLSIRKVWESTAAPTGSASVISFPSTCRAPSLRGARVLTMTSSPVYLAPVCCVTWQTGGFSVRLAPPTSLAWDKLQGRLTP